MNTRFATGLTMICASALAVLTVQVVAQRVERLEGKNVSIAQTNFKGRSAIQLIATPGAPNAGSYAVVTDSVFRDGSIEVDLAGQPAAGAASGARGFIGIAFRLQADGRYEYIYLRPTNGRADDQVRRNHSTQYSAFPDFDFARLRKEQPENWVGPGTEGYFSNLKIAGKNVPGSTVGLAQSQIASTSTIVFVSTRDEPGADPALDPQRAWAASEIYASDETWTSARRLTTNTVPDFLPALSPDGSRVVFDSTRRRSDGEPLNTSDLFVMNADGTDQQFLVRGSSATWSPDGRRLAFHASASGTGLPIKADPGAATQDSDIFILDGIDGLRSLGKPRNLTATPAAIDDDADWSPDGRTIVFTSHAAADNAVNSPTAEIYSVNADGTGKPVRLTNNAEEERAPSWSPDGKRILFCCRRNGPDLEICIMNADGSGEIVLTNNAAPDLTPTWSPDAKKIVFHRPVGGAARFQLFSIAVDGAGETQLTFPPGLNAFPNWESIRQRR